MNEGTRTHYAKIECPYCKKLYSKSYMYKHVNNAHGVALKMGEPIRYMKVGWKDWVLNGLMPH